MTMKQPSSSSQNNKNAQEDKRTKSSTVKGNGKQSFRRRMIIPVKKVKQLKRENGQEDTEAPKKRQEKRMEAEATEK
ncbi:hypothetical protein KIL84_007840 [Mauremys mutica]|uniref:Uncharacterized protein n=1 Tax=Mauremys mutica TaxID=74926 RepID=A0A9D3X224_9SAUR|nr:hypothetical protein KIL84_007840 [Mauremys mutica]